MIQASYTVLQLLLLPEDFACDMDLREQSFNLAKLEFGCP